MSGGNASKDNLEQKYTTDNAEPDHGETSANEEDDGPIKIDLVDTIHIEKPQFLNLVVFRQNFVLFRFVPECIL